MEENTKGLSLNTSILPFFNDHRLVDGKTSWPFTYGTPADFFEHRLESPMQAKKTLLPDPILPTFGLLNGGANSNAVQPPYTVNTMNSSDYNISGADYAAAGLVMRNGNEKEEAVDFNDLVPCIAHRYLSDIDAAEPPNGLGDELLPLNSHIPATVGNSALLPPPPPSLQRLPLRHSQLFSMHGPLPATAEMEISTPSHVSSETKAKMHAGNDDETECRRKFKEVELETAWSRLFADEQPLQLPPAIKPPAVTDVDDLHDNISLSDYAVENANMPLDVSAVAVRPPERISTDVLFSNDRNQDYRLDEINSTSTLRAASQISGRKPLPAEELAPHQRKVQLFADDIISQMEHRDLPVAVRLRPSRTSNALFTSDNQVVHLKDVINVSNLGSDESFKKLIIIRGPKQHFKTAAAMRISEDFKQNVINYPPTANSREFSSRVVCAQDMDPRLYKLQTEEQDNADEARLSPFAHNEDIRCTTGDKAAFNVTKLMDHFNARNIGFLIILDGRFEFRDELQKMMLELLKPYKDVEVFVLDICYELIRHNCITLNSSSISWHPELLSAWKFLRTVDVDRDWLDSLVAAAQNADAAKKAHVREQFEHRINEARNQPEVSSKRAYLAEPQDFAPPNALLDCPISNTACDKLHAEPLLASPPLKRGKIQPAVSPPIDTSIRSNDDNAEKFEKQKRSDEFNDAEGVRPTSDILLRQLLKSSAGKLTHRGGPPPPPILKRQKRSNTFGPPSVSAEMDRTSFGPPKISRRRSPATSDTFSPPSRPIKREVMDAMNCDDAVDNTARINLPSRGPPTTLRNAAPSATDSVGRQRGPPTTTRADLIVVEALRRDQMERQQQIITTIRQPLAFLPAVFDSVRTELEESTHFSDNAVGAATVRDEITFSSTADADDSFDAVTDDTELISPSPPPPPPPTDFAANRSTLTINESWLTNAVDEAVIDPSAGVCPAKEPKTKVEFNGPTLAEMADSFVMLNYRKTAKSSRKRLHQDGDADKAHKKHKKHSLTTGQLLPPRAKSPSKTRKVTVSAEEKTVGSTLVNGEVKLKSETENFSSPPLDFKAALYKMLRPLQDDGLLSAESLERMKKKVAESLAADDVQSPVVNNAEDAIKPDPVSSVADNEDDDDELLTKRKKSTRPLWENDDDVVPSSTPVSTSVDSKITSDLSKRDSVKPVTAPTVDPKPKTPSAAAVNASKPSKCATQPTMPSLPLYKPLPRRIAFNFPLHLHEKLSSSPSSSLDFEKDEWLPTRLTDTLLFATPTTTAYSGSVHESASLCLPQFGLAGFTMDSVRYWHFGEDDEGKSIGMKTTSQLATATLAPLHPLQITTLK